MNTEMERSLQTLWNAPVFTAWIGYEAKSDVHLSYKYGQTQHVEPDAVKSPSTYHACFENSH